MPLTQYRDAEPLSPVYRLLATLPRGPVIELPVLVRAQRLSASRVLHAEFDGALDAAHQRLQRSHPAGFSRHGDRRSARFRRANRSRILGERGARYVVFHLNIYNARLAPAAARASRDLLASTCGRWCAKGTCGSTKSSTGRTRLVRRARAAAHVAARLGSGASFAPRQQRHRLQHLGRRVGAASAAARSAAPVRGADLLSRSTTPWRSRST